jgi:preprotein translocase subunit SecG
MTTAMAVVFFVTSFSLAVFAKQRAEVAGEAGIPTVQESPADTGSASQAPAADEQPADSGSGTGDKIPELE